LFPKKKEEVATAVPTFLGKVRRTRRGPRRSRCRAARPGQGIPPWRSPWPPRSCRPLVIRFKQSIRVGYVFGHNVGIVWYKRARSAQGWGWTVWERRGAAERLARIWAHGFRLGGVCCPPYLCGYGIGRG